MCHIVHYSIKSTQNRDGIVFERVDYQVIRHVQKRSEHFLVQQNLQKSSDNKQDDCFREGLVRFLIGMSIHMSQKIVTDTMAMVHLASVNMDQD
jgi:hypothetical protein